jgi:pseudaminic acid cytidylyltransferase
MIDRKNKIAIIPARGGSKRIPRKNIKNFAGNPMISYAIRAAIQTQLFDKIVVSTDDTEIAEVARSYGADVPFIRPIQLSDDDTPTLPVIVHAIEECKELGWDFETVCCIYPCVPFLRAIQLIDSLDLYNSSRASFCFPVIEYPSPIQRALTMDSHGCLSSYFPENELTRTQDHVITYHDAGQFYWGSTDSWLTESRIHTNSVGHLIPSWSTIDIDTLGDWKRAEIYWDLIQRLE